MLEVSRGSTSNRPIVTQKTDFLYS